MKNNSSSLKPTFLRDYRQPTHWIRKTNLLFELHEDHAKVTSTLSVEKNKALGESDGAIFLDGEGLQLLSIHLDGAALPENRYQKMEKGLKIEVAADSFELTIATKMDPRANLAFEGLYRTRDMFCTQCEAEGFRRITYTMDRPDVLSVFTVTIRADERRYPMLLSNGNPVSACKLSDGRHEVVWHDPFPKPTYLFALVAGDLGVVRDRFITKSGRSVDLEVYCAHGAEPRCDYAMESLKFAMKWDEEVYGLEYDLSRYMIVVADDFNMGAMENKGLNIFNSKYILAHPQTATDGDFEGILAVVGHEYFHNWTGNRVTCRDWFQLSLKEGLTVFRDQQFSADHGSAAVQRISDIVRLRTVQFAEDAGPMSHPVRPPSYITIDNFYTATVYEKGAEVVRMLHTLIGDQKFRQGITEYFKLYDGQAVTTDDFVHAMEIAGERDLTQFKRWYDQSGTPCVRWSSQWDEEKCRLTLDFEQSCPAGNGQPAKLPFHIPIKIGFLDSSGRDCLGPENDHSQILEMKEFKQRFELDGFQERPVISCFRSFSAPIRIESDQSDDALYFLMENDSDLVNRWEASQTLMTRALFPEIQARAAGSATPPRFPERLLEGLGKMISSEADPAYVALILNPPTERYLQQLFRPLDVMAVNRSREALIRAIAGHNRSRFVKKYETLWAKGGVGGTVQARGERALRNSCLMFLCLSDDVRDLTLAVRQRREARDMTTELGALEAVARSRQAARHTIVSEFREKWRNEPLVMDKWLSIVATSPFAESADEVSALIEDPIFDRNNPNRIASLLVAFGRMNTIGFHQESGAGYALIADQVIDIDKRNPHKAAALALSFSIYGQLTVERRTLMEPHIHRIVENAQSTNLREVLDRVLKEAPTNYPGTSS